jgi:hypothetical protein
MPPHCCINNTPALVVRGESDITLPYTHGVLLRLNTHPRYRTQYAVCADIVDAHAFNSDMSLFVASHDFVDFVHP